MGLGIAELERGCEMWLDISAFIHYECTIPMGGTDMLKNITLSAEEELIRKAREKAQRERAVPSTRKKEEKEKEEKQGRLFRCSL